MYYPTWAIDNRWHSITIYKISWLYRKSIKIDKRICCEKSIIVDFLSVLSILSKIIDFVGNIFVSKYVSFNNDDNLYNQL